MMQLPLLTLLLSVLWCTQVQAQANKLQIAVAANFAQPLQHIIGQFKALYKVDIATTVGASGVLYSQIRHGAPYDIFLSADSLRPKRLAELGDVASSDVQVYALGKLAIVGDIAGLEALPSVANTQRIAIADPRLAPYGMASKEVLEALQLWPDLGDKLIRGKNIQQTLQFWQTGNVDIAFVAASQCVSYHLSCKAVPAELHAPIVQCLALLAQGESRVMAQRFVAYLLSPKVQQGFQALGYNAVSALPNTATVAEEHKGGS